MSGSLKDQLIALGLAKREPEKGKIVAGKKHPAGRKAPKKPMPEMTAAGLSLDQAWRLREQDEKAAAEAKKQKKLEQDLLRRQINAQIQELVNGNALNDPAAELKRNFLYKGRIRSVLVTEAQLTALNAGDLGLVFLRGSYYLMTPDKVEAARVISPDHVPDLAAKSGDEDEEFPVPDDLMW